MPGVDVFGVASGFHAYVVPAGRSSLLPMLSSAFGCALCFTVVSLAVGVASSLCGVTFTTTSTSSVDVSG